MEWISVEDRVPEDDRDVLVHYYNGYMGNAFVNWIDGINRGWCVSEVEITHWMEMPKPPEEFSD